MVGWPDIGGTGEREIDTFDWTPVEFGSRSAHKGGAGRSMMQGGDGFLLPAESILEEASGVVLFNLSEAGTLFVTNFRIIFVGGKGATQLIPLGTIPLLTIENFSKQVVKAPVVSSSTTPRRLLTIFGKDLRTITFGFLAHTKQRRRVREVLAYRTRPTRLWELYAFSDNFPTSGDPRDRLRAEYLRLMSFQNNVEAPQRGSAWRLCEVNADYAVCQTYPSLMIMPTSISDDEVQQAALFRSRGRIPHHCWQHPGNGAVLARSSQPFTGFGMTRSTADEKLVAAICNNTPTRPRKLYIADARPRKNALANGAMGGGSESSANYLLSEVIFLGIDNIHGMRDSLTKMRDFLDIHGACSSDGWSSLTRSGGRAWVGGNVASVAGAASALGDSGWLLHCHKILTSAVWIATRIHIEGASVLVHCSDGWDRTAQLVGLASLLLDPYYRTFQGFQALVEKDWLAFGHLFSERLGIPTFTGTRSMAATESIMRQAGHASTSPVRVAIETSSTPVGSNSPSAQSSQYSPIFLQWMDAVAQLLRIYPAAFEFTQAYLVELVDSVLSCRFGNFLCNSEKERVQGGVTESSGCVWAYLKQLREQRGRKHEHYNLFYNRAQSVGVLLPPPAASSPSLWRQYFLRWSCPSLARTGGLHPEGWEHGGDLEEAAHGLAETFSSIQNAKEEAEEKVHQLLAEKQLLQEQLHEEQQGRISALATAKRGQRETAALKQVIEAVGCKIRIKNLAPQPLDTSDEDSADIEGEFGDSRGQTSSPTLVTGQQDDREEPQLSVSVSMRSDMDVTSDVLRRPCGADYNSSCRLRPGESCRWPQTGCARIGSAFIGLRADFGALGRLAILESYFDTEQPDLEGELDVRGSPSHSSGVT